MTVTFENNELDFYETSEISINMLVLHVYVEESEHSKTITAKNLFLI